MKHTRDTKATFLKTNELGPGGCELSVTLTPGILPADLSRAGHAKRGATDEFYYFHIPTEEDQIDFTKRHSSSVILETVKVLC